MGEEDNLIIKQLTTRAIHEFEEVQVKCKDYYEKLFIEQKKCKTLESQFKQLKQVSLLAVAEYESLHKQYVEENKYREEVEKNLKKVKDENAEIRKQNNINATTTIIASQPNSNDAQETKGELELLRSLKNAVNDELRTTKNELTSLKEQLQQEKDAHEVTKQNLSMNVDQVGQLNRVSIMALNEYNELKKKYDIEVECRLKAEDLATELVSQQKLDERKSRIMFIENNNEDEQLEKFMAEIEELNALKDLQTRESNEKIKELEEQIASTDNTDTLKSLEDKLSLVMDQLDLSQKQLVASDERAVKAEHETRNLYAKLAQCQAGNESYVSIPPPPPPPPPPIAAPVIRKFITRLGRKKKGGAVGKDQEEDPRINAMVEMVSRIKKGVKLRSVNSPAKLNDKPDDDDNSAMGELAGLLNNMKKGRKASRDNLDSASSENKQPEFTMIKLKKSSKAASFDSVLTAPTSELQKKLHKQKSVADGIETPSVDIKLNSEVSISVENNVKECHSEAPCEKLANEEKVLNIKADASIEIENSDLKSETEQITEVKEKDSETKGNNANDIVTVVEMKKKPRKELNRGSWEAEMIIDATRRENEIDNDKSLNEEEEKASKKENRKSVEDVFDDLLNGMIVSIDDSAKN